METTSTNNIVILKRPSTVQETKSDEKAKIIPVTKSLEEKQAQYKAARRRILGTDNDHSSDGQETNEDDPESLKEPLSACEKGSPDQQKNEKPVTITPLMSIEFKQSSEISLENAMETMTLANGQSMKDQTRKKQALFRVDQSESIAADSFGLPMGPQRKMSGHCFASPVPNSFHIRQNVNHGLIHPYANSSVNHVRAHHLPHSHANQRFRFNQPPPMHPSQANFVQASPIPVNVPPPGYFRPVNGQIHLMPPYVPSQVTLRQPNGDIIGQMSEAHNRRHPDFNF